MISNQFYFQIIYFWPFHPKNCGENKLIITVKFKFPNSTLPFGIWLLLKGLLFTVLTKRGNTHQWYGDRTFRYFFYFWPDTDVLSLCLCALSLFNSITFFGSINIDTLESNMIAGGGVPGTYNFLFNLTN